MSFYRARLENSDVLYKVIDHEMFPYAIAETIGRLKNPNIYVFFTDAEDAIVVYEPVYGNVPWMNTHTWTLKSARGKKLKDFYLRTGVWMMDNTETTAITMVVPERMRRQGLFLATIGAKRQCEINGEVLYSFDIEQLEEIRRRLQW